jgi:hypothetical protein
LQIDRHRLTDPHFTIPPRFQTTTLTKFNHFNLNPASPTLSPPSPSLSLSNPSFRDALNMLLRFCSQNLSVVASLRLQLMLMMMMLLQQEVYGVLTYWLED